jgi:hypothetical protein
MAICRIIETGRTPTEYDQVRSNLGTGDSVPAGSTLHIAALGDDGKIRVIELWDSREQADEFTEKIRVAREEAGFGGDMPVPTYFDVHKVVE